MNGSRAEIENRLAQEVEACTPDVLPNVLHTLQDQEGDARNMNTTATIIPAPLVEVPNRTVRKSRTMFRWAAGMAAALVLLFGLGFGYFYYVPEAIIGFDVNPSVELKVNRVGKVISADALNEDAEIILNGMDLKSVDLEVAVNALIGSMVKNGYLSEIKNSILISVDSRDQQVGEELQKQLTEEVDGLLSVYSMNGAVLSQTVSEDQRLKNLAAEYNISIGKAALVDQLVSQDDTLNFGDIASLPINDINLLINARQTNLQGVEVSGQASSDAYIGEESAKAIALSHAGLEESAIRLLKLELDYEDGRMVYEVEFIGDTTEYEYEIDATTGDIVKYDHDILNSSGAQSNANLIGET